jgi:hypothetical protein
MFKKHRGRKERNGVLDFCRQSLTEGRAAAGGQPGLGLPGAVPHLQRPPSAHSVMPRAEGCTPCGQPCTALWEARLGNGAPTGTAGAPWESSMAAPGHPMGALTRQRCPYETSTGSSAVE